MYSIKIYSVKLKNLITLSLTMIGLFAFNIAQAQDKSVSGNVKTEKGETLPGVSVVVKGTTNGTVTNVNGDYTINVDSDDAILVFSFIGMKTQEAIIGSRASLDVAMADDIAALEEVVVIGYGEQRKSVLTAAISSVKAEDLASFSAGSVDQALQGRMAGVQIVPTSGSPGSGYDVKIRGAGSNSATSPLYIVDGMRVPSINFLDPFEIESVEVLKDAASAAIYGAEGANGVVYVTTKGGKIGPGVVNYDMQYGWQNENSPLEVMNLDQFETYNTEAGVNNRRPEEQLPSEGTDWKNELFENNAPLQRHGLSFSGGTEKTKYLLGGYFFTQDGIIGGEKSGFNRYSLRFNVEHKVNDWLKVSSRYSYQRYENSSIQENSEFGGIAQNGLAMDPATPVVYENGIPPWIINAYGSLDENAYKTNSDGLYWGMSTLVDGEISNPLAKLEQIHGSNITTGLVGSSAITINPIEGLDITSRVGTISGYVYDHYWQEDWFFNDRDTESARASDTYSDFFNYQWENYASYAKKLLLDHNINVLVGTSFFSSENGYVTGNASTLSNAVPELSYLDAVPSRVENTDANGNRNTYTLSSYFSRLTYNFKDKYLLGATMRADGSSLLSANNRWGYFPSVSAGWVVSGENFFPSGVFNYLKVRASWGQNGSLSSLTSQSTGASLALVNSGFIYEDDEGVFQVGSEPIQLANPDLTWETSEQVDIGLDFGFFDDKITASVDYFIKDTKDLIISGNAPGFVGNPIAAINGGDVQNRGWEFELSYLNKSNELKYDIGLNLTVIQNEVINVNTEGDFIGGANIGTDWTDATAMEEGKSIWYFRGYETSGIFQNQAEIDLYTEDIAGYDPEPGDAIINDTNDDGQISTDDFVEIGSAQADFSIGTTIKLEYKGFDLNIFAQGSFGQEIIMGFNRTDRITANKPEFFYTDRWTEEGSTNDWFKAGTDTRAYTSDMMVFDGSYLKIRQMQLGYNLPESFLDKAGLTKLRLYISLDNFFTFTNYQGFDPEVGGGTGNTVGIDRGSYPVPRTLLTGLTLQF